MQQTDKYQLNLIETSDTFSPAPLNENAQKLEAVIAAETAAEAAARAAADAALDQRVSVLELHKCVVGTFNAAVDATNDIDLGFAPCAVLISRPYLGGFACFTIRGTPALYSRTSSSTGIALELTDNGFHLSGYLAENALHCFVAFA